MFLEIENISQKRSLFILFSLACCGKCRETIYGENISRGIGRGM
jgi:hypothetical protein